MRVIYLFCFKETSQLEEFFKFLFQKIQHTLSDMFKHSPSNVKNTKRNSRKTEVTSPVNKN